MILKSFCLLLFRVKARSRKLLALSTVLACAFSPFIGAAIDIYAFNSEGDRRRYNALAEELRCPKCQNQNLSGSDSGISKDLRDELARLVMAGETDMQIKDYMVDRYGDFVLYDPPFKHNTLVLWTAPAVMLGLGLLVFIFIVLRRRRISPEVDTAD